MSTPNNRTSPPDDFSAPGKKPVQVGKHGPGNESSEEREKRLQKRKANLEFAVRCAFSGLCGGLTLRYPPCFLLFLLFMAYVYVMQL